LRLVHQPLDRDQTALLVCIVAADVEPQVTGEGKDALHGLSVEFGRVLGGM